MASLRSFFGARREVECHFQSVVATPNDSDFSFVTSMKVRNEDQRDNSFLFPSPMIQSNSRDIIEVAGEITAGRTTDREKALAIHDWIARNLTYDYDGLNSGEYLSKPYDARSVLSSKLAVCEGFSTLYAALLRASGIRAKVVYGKRYLKGIPRDYKSKEDICQSPPSTEHDHAWNEIYLDNRWVSVDTIMDSGYSKDNTTKGYMRTPGNYQYFDQSPTQFDGVYVKCTDRMF
jgi:transglutaminase/protease-like cytokinesis protein 3